MSGDDTDLKQTALHGWHESAGGKMVPFAGYSMPVQYPDGILAEHHHTRANASVFDVGHMGQALLKGDNPAALMEELVPGDISGLDTNQIRYTQLTNDQGGIIDDLMVTQTGDALYLVVNAGCKDKDYARIRDVLGSRADLEILENQALLALQGPKAAEVLAGFAPEATTMSFMTSAELDVAGIPCRVSRSGYTGEDGYEISIPNSRAEELATLLCGDEKVKPAGLGARDTLRLEAGLCLYGNDINETTTPVEAALTWSIGKRRREEGGFPGADVIQAQIQDGAPRKRVGIKPAGKAPARAHTEIVDESGNRLGEVTSGGFGPTAEGPVAMGYVKTAHTAPDTKLGLIVRGKPLEANVVRLPFVKHQYVKS